MVQREERLIPPGDTATHELPPVDQGGKPLLLEFEARMESPQPGGSMFYLDVRLNGRPVTAAQDRLTGRLLNKPVGVPYGDGMLYWCAAGTGWRIVYAPDFASFGPAQNHGPEPYRFVIDVTDMLRAGQANELFINRVRADWGVNDVTVNGPHGFVQPIGYGREGAEVTALRGHLQAGRQCGIITDVGGFS